MTAGLATPPAPAGSATTAEVARTRVAVLVATYQVDVVLPTKFSIETFIDDLIAVLAQAIADDDIDFTPDTGQWSLARPGQPPIPRWRTLAEHNVDDGTVLMLTPVESTEIFTPIVEDVTDALALINEREFSEFDGATAATTGLAAWNVGVLTVSVLLTWMWSQTADLLSCALPALVLGLACWAAALVAGRREMAPRTCLGLALSSIPALFAGGAMLVPPAFDEPGRFAAANLAAGAVVAAVAAATMIRMTKLGIATLTAVTTFGLLLTIATVTLTYVDLRVAQVSSGAVIVGLILLAMSPRIAVAIARIRPPDLPDPGDQVSRETLTDIFDAESGTEPEPDLDERKRKLGADIESRARLAVTTLRGLIAATATVTAGATVLTCAAEPGGIRGIVMAAAVAGILTLRSRWFPDRVQALAFISAAAAITVGVTAVLVQHYHSPSARLIVLATVLVIALGACVAAVRLPGVRLSPVTRRVIDLFEYALLVIVPVLAFWIMGIYTRMRQL